MMKLLEPMGDLQGRMKMQRDVFWTQQCELNFLEGLGTYAFGTPNDVKKVSPLHRRNLLEGYLKAMDTCHRKWFSGADVPKIRATVVRMIRETHAREAAFNGTVHRGQF